MTDKPTYNAAELAAALRIKKRKVEDLLRKDKIKHTHVNKTHASARIPKEELERLLILQKDESV